MSGESEYDALERTYGKVPDSEKARPGKNPNERDSSANPYLGVFKDMSDNIGTQRPTNYANGHIIHIHSLATNATTHFKAFITDFKDNFSSTWNEEDVFGRMDTIPTFERTKRKISLAWDVPAASIEEAKFNLTEAERLISMLYPTYEEIEVGGAPSLTSAEKDTVQTLRTALKNGNVPSDVIEEVETNVRNQMLSDNRVGASRKVGIMAASPLIKIKFSNWMIDNRNSAKIGGGAKRHGLICVLHGLSWEPDLDAGFFGHEEADDVRRGALIPQTLRFSCELTVLHTAPLGWKLNRGGKRSILFPYHSIRARKRG